MKTEQNRERFPEAAPSRTGAGAENHRWGGQERCALRSGSRAGAIRRANRAGANAPARPRAIARGIVGPPRRTAGRRENEAKTDREERPMPETASRRNRAEYPERRTGTTAAGPVRPRHADPAHDKHDIP